MPSSPLILRLMRDRVAGEVVSTFRGWIHRVPESDGVVGAVVSRTRFSLSTWLTRTLVLATGDKILLKVSLGLRSVS